LRNDLLVRLERSEVQAALLSLPNRERLMTLPGIPRHRPATAAEQQALADCKIGIADHLRRLAVLDASGRVQRRAIAISNRNLGTNHGHIAWQRGETPRLFRVAEDPCDYSPYSCLTVWRSGTISIEDLDFDFSGQRVLDASGGRDLSDEIEWATFGQRVLGSGKIVRIEQIAPQFYDIRHVLAFDPLRREGEQTRQALYEGYPRSFADNVRSALTRGVPRARYFHNAIGVTATGIVIIQREGTVEEVGAALKEAGADDGVILDNGGSVACWAWWIEDYRGGLVSPTIDYRPPGTSAIAFVLEGALRPSLPGGSISYTVY
jgi:hypothetical protein